MIFRTTTKKDSPLDSSSEGGETVAVSNFLTDQSFMNFAAMGGSITIAWKVLISLDPRLSSQYVPLVFAFSWGLIAVVMSLDGLKTASEGWRNTRFFGQFGKAVLFAVVNSLVLAGAVLGVDGVLTGPVQ